MADVADEEPDAAAVVGKAQPPDDIDIPVGAEFAWSAFWTLHHDRPYVTTGHAAPMGAVVITPRPGRISFSAIDRYARRYGIEGGAFDLLVELISRLDGEFMKWEAEKAREAAGQ